MWLVRGHRWKTCDRSSGKSSHEEIRGNNDGVWGRIVRIGKGWTEFEGYQDEVRGTWRWVKGMNGGAWEIWEMFDDGLSLRLRARKNKKGRVYCSCGNLLGIQSRNSLCRNNFRLISAPQDKKRRCWGCGYEEKMRGKGAVEGARFTFLSKENYRPLVKVGRIAGLRHRLAGIYLTTNQLTCDVCHVTTRPVSAIIWVR